MVLPWHEELRWGDLSRSWLHLILGFISLEIAQGSFLGSFTQVGYDALAGEKAQLPPTADESVLTKMKEMYSGREDL